MGEVSVSGESVGMHVHCGVPTTALGHMSA